MFETLTKKEHALLKRLNTPAKIQDYLNILKFNFEPNGDTCYSPRVVIRTQMAHCMEGATLAALALTYHGEKPLLLDLKVADTNHNDFDHVVALFKRDGCWGALSKTNHAVLRYREPIYCSIRELALSYFHEYFTHDGKKNLRSYSTPFNLQKFNKKNWAISEEDIWYIPLALCDIKHISIITKKSARQLRRADPIEIKAGKLTQH